MSSDKRFPAAILFDVDGTLADTERDGHRIAFNRAFADAGLGWEWDVPLYGELLGVTGGGARIRHYIETYLPDFRAPDTLAQVYSPGMDEFIAGLHKAKTAHYTSLVRDQGLPLRPGVRRLMQECVDAGVPMAIATTTTRANVDALLERNELDEAMFTVIGAADVVPVLKPEPDVFLYALEHLGLPANECLAVEDSRNGLRASLAAKLPTLITVNEYTQGQDFTGAALVVDGLGEPGQPFTVLAGDGGDKQLVDLELAGTLVAKAS
jgi:HAD superfamily hydrolase (TIGR01509 family)